MALDKKALGAALTTLGGELEKGRLQREEQKRSDEAEAREERRLQIQEKDAEQRREMNRIKLNMNKAQWNNEQIMKAAAQSEFDPAVMGRAFTNHGGDSLVWEFNNMQSSKDAGGNFDRIVFDMGTFEAKGAGVSGVGGVPTTKPLAGGMQKIFETDEQSTAHEKLVNFTSGIANPNNLFARHEAGITAEQQQQRALDAKEAAAKIAEASQSRQQAAFRESPEGKRKARAEEADIALTEKRTATLGVGGPDSGGSVVKGFKGEDVKITKEKAQTLRAALPIVAKKYTDVNSENDVWKIDQVRNNKKVRDTMNQNIKRVLDGDLSDAELVQSARDDLGLSGEFTQELIDTARANQEAWEEDLASKTPNLLQRTVNKIIGTSFGTGG